MALLQLGASVRSSIPFSIWLFTELNSVETGEKLIDALTLSLANYLLRQLVANMCLEACWTSKQNTTFRISLIGDCG